ncbi:SRPBCC domain-containing protein [Algoriphagus sp. AGSA1]|uniref:SRPBCC family protein n=1 Tax=Algoriphagus sp. AGSA1 TaxID=2907213 RepID=UPI001F3126A0|nr:SRPBCC domain-containing protein [Algoriphagus sp. AGSA1]MCE7053877.1 SRPBCC domain-containing protein [Algoriphagus sp. AGSA1]
MKNQDFKLTLLVDRPPTKVFEVIKNVPGWWSGWHEEKFEGKWEKLNDEFSFTAAGGAHYSLQKLIELVPDKKIVWLVTESELSYIGDTTEWVDTQICFELFQEDKGTKIVFTHKGLIPEAECYGSCSVSWTDYLQKSLLKMVSTIV